MRISNVDATLAKDQATKALNDNQGVLEGARETIAVMGKNYINPLCAVAGWGEVYMNASMESIVNGYEDPRGKKWYNTALLEGYQKQLLGIPIGLPMKDGDATFTVFALPSTQVPSAKRRSRIDECGRSLAAQAEAASVAIPKRIPAHAMNTG